MSFSAIDRLGIREKIAEMKLKAEKMEMGCRQLQLDCKRLKEALEAGWYGEE